MNNSPQNLLKNLNASSLNRLNDPILYSNLFNNNHTFVPPHNTTLYNNQILYHNTISHTNNPNPYNPLLSNNYNFNDNNQMLYGSNSHYQDYPYPRPDSNH